MKMVDIFRMENERDDSSKWNIIYVNKEGTFYRLYNWSAWLLKSFVCTEEFQKERGDEKMLSVMCYQAKNDNSYVMCGFPIESISKYIPAYQNLKTLGDGSLEITIDYPFGSSEKEMIFGDYEIWKAMCPVKEKTKTQKVFSGGVQQSALGKSGIFSLISSVLSYPIEKSTPAQNAEFISSLKSRCAAFL